MIRSITASLLFAISLSAAVINVPADHAAIQAVIDAAVDGDTVLVQPGRPGFEQLFPPFCTTRHLNWSGKVKGIRR